MSMESVAAATNVGASVWDGAVLGVAEEAAVSDTPEAL
jgi:hypothetical protein